MSAYQRHVRGNVRKHTFGHMRPVKIQISLRIRAVWPESLLGAFWIAKGAMFSHADNEDFEQTARMCRLIWVFVGRTCQKVRSTMLQLLYCHAEFLWISPILIESGSRIWLPLQLLFICPHGAGVFSNEPCTSTNMISDFLFQCTKPFYTFLHFYS